MQAIFTASCAFDGCHGGTSPAADLDLTAADSYAALVGIPSQACAPMLRVRPFQSDSSCLVKRLTGEVPPQMPLGGSLTAREIATIAGWVQQGAPPGPPVLAAR